MKAEKKPQTGEQIVERWRHNSSNTSMRGMNFRRGKNVARLECADELATFLEGLRELSAEWPHDFTKLRGPHDGAEKAKCKRCQIEKRLGERVTGGEKHGA